MKINNSRTKAKNLTILKEGKAKFFLFDNDIDSIPTKSMDVFYNKRMEINRDITCLAVQSYSEMFNETNLNIIDSMAGSGIGAIRLLKECDNIQKLNINDINPTARDLIMENLKLNNLTEKKVDIKVTRKDANFLFGEITQKYLTNDPSFKKKPNVISIDPFGTPNLYTDGAFKAIQKQKGLLCITATDTAVLFGIKPKACHRKYMSKPLHNEFCKEIGARILLYFLACMANINGLGINPMLTFYHGHFIRAFVSTFPEKKAIVKQFENYKFLIYCKNCGHRFIIDVNPLHNGILCELCGEHSDLDFAGPIWTGNIHDSDFLMKLKEINNAFKLKNKDKLERIIGFCKEELSMPISYYNIHKLCKELKSKSIPKMEDLLEMIKNQGYKASRTHFDFTSIKTDMSINNVKDLMLEMDEEG